MTERAALLDLDGTLSDPAKGIFGSIRHAMDGLGLRSPPDRELRPLIGPPLHESFRQLGLDETLVPRAIELFRERFSTAGLFENELYDGIEAALAELRADVDRLAVATSKPTVFARRIVDHFQISEHFDVVVGSELDGSRTDKAEVISEAMSQLGVDPEGCVMVGDRRLDVLGAKSLGVLCLGVAWGYAEPGELEAAGATKVLAKPAQLADAVVRLLDPAHDADADRPGQY